MKLFVKVPVKILKRSDITLLGSAYNLNANSSDPN